MSRRRNRRRLRGAWGIRLFEGAGAGRPALFGLARLGLQGDWPRTPSIEYATTFSSLMISAAPLTPTALGSNASLSTSNSIS